MLPFYGKAHVAYIPNGKVIGLSKIPRIVEMFARRLQVQERMTQQIADFLQETLQAQGVAVVVEGQHMCAAMRGVKKANARMTQRDAGQLQAQSSDAWRVPGSRGTPRSALRSSSSTQRLRVHPLGRF